MDTNGHTILSEDYVSFEVAKLLKEKGFDESCRTYYQDKEFVDDVCTQYYQWNTKSPFDHISAPTHQMAMKWFREVHHIFIIIEPYSDINCYFSLWEGDNYYENPLRKGFPSYEETVEAALKYCLENLI